MGKGGKGSTVREGKIGRLEREGQVREGERWQGERRREGDGPDRQRHNRRDR